MQARCRRTRNHQVYLLVSGLLILTLESRRGTVLLVLTMGADRLLNRYRRHCMGKLTQGSGLLRLRLKHALLRHLSDCETKLVPQHLVRVGAIVRALPDESIQSLLVLCRLAEFVPQLEVLGG